MQKLTFSTTINAPRAEVWRTMLEDSGYREWPGVFHAGSYAGTDWKEGGKALFLTPEGDGMASRIAAHRPDEFLSIEHLGTVHKGVEDAGAAAAQGWAGAHENYRLRDADSGCELTVEMDAADEHRSYFDETWPKALDKPKRMGEGKRGRPA